jgi:membrane associated rhomboid family serine protease
MEPEPTMPSPEDAAEPPLTPIRRYTALAEARVASLALAAKEITYEIDRDGDGWLLMVEAPMAEAALAELNGFEAEEAQAPPPPEPRRLDAVRLSSIWAVGLLLASFYLAQQMKGPLMLASGDADGDAILRGEWWRCVTALTLHADGGHLIANLAFGALFIAFLIPQLGGGLAWILVVLSGALGNLINSWGYRGDGHHSIGASTAVFGGLGLLVGCELFHRWISPSTRSRWQLVVPLGGGLALLAYLGVGEKHEPIDFMAHCWGFVTGLGLGLIAPAWQRRARMPGWGQAALGLAALAAVLLCWAEALGRAR